MPLLIADPDAEPIIIRKRMTLAELNALPDDPERDRFLIQGELWDLPMTKRNRRHARVEAQIAFLLKLWLRSRGSDFGNVFSGEVGCDLPNMETGVGIDVAVFSAEVLNRQLPNAPYIVGAPVLAVEILSPSDTVELTDTKTQNYIEAGVKFVWIINTVLQTVTVHSPGVPPTMLRLHEELVGDPHLPGLVIPVRSIFE